MEGLILPLLLFVIMYFALIRPQQRKMKEQQALIAKAGEGDRIMLSSGIYGTILYDDLGIDADGNRHQRNVTVFADGEVDRSPCGSGTCSRLAVLADEGVVAPGGPILVHDSIIGSRFEGRVAEQIDVDGRRGWIPVVTGTAHRTGEHVFVLDPDDDLAEGFLLD